MVAIKGDLLLWRLSITIHLFFTPLSLSLKDSTRGVVVDKTWLLQIKKHEEHSLYTALHMIRV